jgi:hypothetical protein
MLLLINILFHFVERSGQGNVKCNTIEATFSQLALTTGFGGNNGYGALGCPSGYMGVGNICMR